ncbi:hemolysin family protein [Sutcliffiella sp. NC1]|nr:hemolysin family protein [Sutcliffiella sp. NC1]WBL17504.1 hemolysin family protein [Sutcliffiella sp. NC1]
MLSAFFSSAETAFSSVNKIRLRNYEESGRKGSKKALYIVDNFDRSLSTILIGNNLVNIAATSISTKVATDLFGAGAGILISTLVMTVLILIFGEILPKSLAKEYAEPYSLKISGILLFLMKLFAPITIMFVYLRRFVSKLFKGGNNDTPSVTEEEIKVMVDISQEEGVLNYNEKELVYRSLEFDDITVGEILKPRIDIVAVEVNQPLEEIRDVFLEERYSRIPVYEDHIDNIIGILSEREFLSNLIQTEHVKIQELLRTPVFVVETMKIATLLPQLQKNKVHMAIVVDEFGGTAGLVTLEDILEELVGEIWDEHDEKVRDFIKINNCKYEFNADIPLEDFYEEMGMDYDKMNQSSHTLGGWLFENFDRIPTIGEQFTFEHITLTIHEVEGRRIRKVLVEISDENVPCDEEEENLNDE